jgi:hypothetical protein
LNSWCFDLNFVLIFISFQCHKSKLRNSSAYLPDQCGGTVCRFFLTAVAPKASLTLMKYQKDNTKYVNINNDNAKKYTRMLQWSLGTKAESKA